MDQLFFKQKMGGSDQTFIHVLKATCYTGPQEIYLYVNTNQSSSLNAFPVKLSHVLSKFTDNSLIEKKQNRN